MIPADLAGFFESGVSILIGSRDPCLFPDCTRAIGARVEAGGTELTVLLPRSTSARAVANLRDNGRIAVAFSRPSDHRSIQVKGRVVALREAEEADRAVVDGYRGALARELAFVGLPPRLTFRMAHWPCLAARLRVEGIFVQTPGPGAGGPLEAPSPAVTR